MCLSPNKNRGIEGGREEKMEGGKNRQTGRQTEKGTERQRICFREGRNRESDTPKVTQITDYRPKIEAKAYITLLPQKHLNLPQYTDRTAVQDPL